MKIKSSSFRPPKRGGTQAPEGFALVITLSLMILLTVIAVGLLSLGSISLRSANTADAMQAARANARVSLMLAIGELQKQMGPDTRISMTGDQLVQGQSYDTSSTPTSQRQWVGVYDSWPAAQPQAQRPAPVFRHWLVSGIEKDLQNLDYVGKAVTGEYMDIVTDKTVGPANPVRVPKLSRTLPNGMKQKFAWWVGDQGVKAWIGESKKVAATVAEARADSQTIPVSQIKDSLVGSAKPFASVQVDDPALGRLASWESAELLGAKNNDIKGLFHDLTTYNRGLLTNVRAGGFRKDLSMELERPRNSQPNPVSTALYTVNNEPGINLQELWAYYNLSSSLNSSQLGVRWASSSVSFTTGGSFSAKTPYMRLPGGPDACVNDEFFFHKQPVVIDYQLVVSLMVTTDPESRTQRVHIVTDPIITLWNPLDIPVEVPAGINFTVKYWQEPYDIVISKNGVDYVCPLAAVSKSDGNFLSLRVGSQNRMVFRPGEVIKMSQFKDLTAGSQAGDLHKLDGKTGFNFGKGVAWPAATAGDAKIDVGPTDTVVFKRAQPNDLTAGQTNSDGKVISGYFRHSRHFSLTHHEYYLGDDREPGGSSGNASLGIGGIFLDYDFGDRRLGATETRSDSQPGTKKSTDRYNALSKSDVFKTFTDGRQIPAGSKMPVMLFSFHAKTERGRLSDTRSFSRFNPKALLVDFFDLSPAEREMLPYEYTVEQLNGWKSANDSLQQDPSGRGYFGAAFNALDGTNYVITHSVPREPITSLAAFQHSFANGFNTQKPKDGYGPLNAREPLLPQISHAIGNSLACPVLSQTEVTGTLAGGRPAADHSYLANQALFDDWFLSGIAPQVNPGFGTSRNQMAVATDFFLGGDAGKLPVSRYRPNLRGNEAGTIVKKLLKSTQPTTVATTEMASYLTVDGMFNVNSTSVEAWKTMLRSRLGRSMVSSDTSGKEGVSSPGAGRTPVSGLFSPRDLPLESGNTGLPDSPQWTGWRALSDTEVDSLARGIVREVRKRGPFISLADFINRRVGTDSDLARAGAIQNALDSQDVSVNSAFNSGGRASGGGAALKFPQAEKGPVSYGAPGIVKQADILTPLAPLLAARSDTFIIRGYGESVDSGNRVLARATCEAVVQREADFVDGSNPAEAVYSSINNVNQRFGRKFTIVSFRWLGANDT